MNNKRKPARASGLSLPDFKDEAEEARWWFEHQDQIAAEFERAAKEGRLGPGPLARKGVTPTTTIRLDQEDIARARKQAERKGLRYQTYLKMLLRVALHAAERKLG